MELMFSSEDEGDSPPSLPEFISHQKPSQLPASQDSIDEELLNSTSRVQVQNRQISPNAMSHKPVISARQLLMSSSNPTVNKVSTGNEKLSSQAIKSGLLVAPKKPLASLTPEKKELTAGERIALKYGLVASAKSKEVLPDSRVQGVHGSIGTSGSSTFEGAAKREETSVATKKRLFWDSETTGVKADIDSKSTYVSPFSDLDGFMNMKRRRRRQSKLSQEEMKIARDAFYNEATNNLQVVGARPRHIIGSAIFENDDADDRMSDSKEITTEADDGAIEIRARSSNLNKSRAHNQNNNHVLKRNSRQRLPKVDGDFSDGSNEVFMSEQWPKLDPPTAYTGPMMLSLSIMGKPATFQVCANLNRYLFDYQREGVEFLIGAYTRDTGAILGDDMGLGKTIQVIACLSAIMVKHGNYRDKDTWRALLHDRRERFSTIDAVGRPEDTGFSFNGEVAPILIVMPASLLQNWEQELHTWICCTTINLRGKSSERDDMIDQIARGEYEIVICSYDILKLYSNRLHKIDWEVVILDEMHCLKNPDAKLTQAVKAIRCRRKLGLTGTLMQNNEKELHCLVDTIAPGAFGSWAEFSLYYGQDIKYGRKKSAAPEAVERSRQKEKELRQKLIPYYLRREKAINPTFQTVKKNDQVVFCDLTPLQLAAYQRVMAMPEFQLLQRGEEKCDCGRDTDLGNGRGLLYERFHEQEPCKNCPNCMGLPCVAMLLKISNHLELLKVNPYDSSELQNYQREFARIAFDSDLDEVGGVNQVSSFQEMCAISTKTCGKMIVLEKLLAVWEKRRQKTLIFSRSTRMLDIIQLFLITKAVRYSRLDGNTKVEERLKMVNEFNSGDSDMTVFLISTRAGGVGLNLQSATNVVIFDPSWNPAHDCQAQDRAYRIGQTKDVQVYRLITLGTIEEMIYVRQIYKQQLSDTTLKGSNAPRYFEGVQGNPQQRGELFGVANLICWKPGGVLKGIQDAYIQCRDGFTMQQNQVRHEAATMKRMVKSSTPKLHHVADDDGEMIEIAGELVSNIMIPDEPPTQTLRKEKPVAEDISNSEDDLKALSGATTFYHEEIFGKQDGEGDGHHEEVYNGSCSEVEADSDICRTTSSTSHASNQQALLSHPLFHEKSCISSPMKATKGPKVASKETQKRMYVPAYL
ncbi:hypothetical protein CCR75_008278 [Bremia lactucae]|uniref:Uncharacterized protein n=1 Tax=Bremia lactucae TaxID=4779 RepID=A0A976IIY8_BRELC|nr:hypothetical protein CCR75_008278 [Bremia lactucae]